MKTVHIVVRDSYHTEAIAHFLERYYGGRFPGIKVKCHASRPPTPRTRVHILVLSGIQITRDPGLIDEARAEIGKKNAKVVATSALDEILDEIKSNPRFKVDFIIPKKNLQPDIVGESRLNDEEAEQLLNTILQSVL